MSSFRGPAFVLVLWASAGCEGEEEPFPNIRSPRSESCGSPGGESLLLLEAGFLHGADRFQCDFPDALAVEPRVTDFRGPERVLPGSRTTYKVDWTGTETLEGRSIIAGVEGELGFFRTSSHDFGPPMTVELWTRPTAQERKWELTVAIDDGTGTSNNPVVGPHVLLPLTVVPVQQGGMEFALSWAGPADLDLYVVGPDGQELSRVSGPTETGGVMDLSGNTACGDEDNTEHAVWPFGGVPEGSWQVRVNQRSGCGTVEPTEWWLTVLADGAVLRWTGGIFEPGDVDPATSGAGRPALTFDHPEVDTGDDDSTP